MGGKFLVSDPETESELVLEFVELKEPVKKVSGAGYFGYADFRVDGGEEGQLYEMGFCVRVDGGNIMVTRDNRMGNVFGSKGWVKITSPTSLEVGMRGGDPRTMLVDPIDPVRANVEGFAAAIAGEMPYRFTNAQMIHDVAVLDAIKCSLISGKREVVL